MLSAVVDVYARHVSVKIVAPYFLLVLGLAVLAYYVVNNLVTSSLEEKFRSQLADSGRAANEAMVKIEGEHLVGFRQMAFTQGVAEALSTGDTIALARLLEPSRVNANLSYVEVVDRRGAVVLALRPAPKEGETAAGIDLSTSEWPPVRAVLDGKSDSMGDKFSGIVQTPSGPVLYTAGPVKLGTDRVGVIAVGTPLQNVVQRMGAEALTGISLYDTSGAVVASTLPGANQQLAVDADLASRLLQGGTEVRLRTIQLGASRYQEMLGTLEVRGQPVLVMGVSQSISLIEDRGAETRRQLALLFAGVALLVVALGLLLARRLVRPIRILAEACRALAAGELYREVPVTTRDETGLLTENFNQSVQGLRERDRAKDAFGRYMSPELYEEIQTGQLRLGGEEREITTLLSDIRGFTSLAEPMDPEDLVQMLNEYFETQVAAIQKYGGSVDKFMGDAILARFGAPVWYPDHAARAVRAMIEMSLALENFNVGRARLGLAPLQIGIGVNTGRTIVGNIGSTARMEYTIIGDTVNATQRIEDLCKEVNWDLLISDTTYEQAKHVVEVGRPYRTVLRGRQQETLVYPVLGIKAEPESSV